MKLDKIWHRGIIKFLNKKRLAPKDIHADMVATLGVTVPSYAIVKRWAAHFKMDKEGLEHDGRCGNPTKATTEEIAAGRHPGSPLPKKTNVVSAAGNVMASNFWDANGIVFIDYLQKAELLTGNIMPVC